MAEDDEAPPAAPNPGLGEEKTPRRGRAENLIPVKPGEVRNPKGINGRVSRAAFLAFADDVDAETGKPRISAAYEALFKKVKRGGDQALKLFIEQYQGRARQHVVLSDPNDGPVRITYDDVRLKLGEITKRALATTVAATNADGSQPDED